MRILQKLVLAVVLISLLSVYMPFPVAGADEVVTFPDFSLEAAIRDAIEKPAGAIYQSEVGNLTKLKAENLGISDITGLEYCDGLTDLSLAYNQISNINALSSLTNLGRLSLRDNQVSDISALSSLTGLIELDLMDNQISDISPLSGLINLTELTLRGNDISDISTISNLTNLTVLNLWDNQVSDISALSNLNSLETLDLEVNQISDISALSNLINLVNLNIWNNQISDISPLVENSGIGTGDYVSLAGNPLSDKSKNDYIPQLQQRGVKGLEGFGPQPTEEDGDEQPTPEDGGPVINGGDEDEGKLNAGVVIGTILGVLVVVSAVYFFVRRGTEAESDEVEEEDEDEDEDKE